jgi:hypothetical protein
MSNSFRISIRFFFSCFLIVGTARADFSAWSKHRNITINTSATGANVKGNVDKFALAVLLDASNFDFSAAKDDGADIRFSTTDGVSLPYQIESWDKAGQKAAVWVKVDVKGNDATQAIMMHWGNPAAASESDGKKIFAAADGWASVWHLAEKGSTATGTYKDASDNPSTGHGVNMKGDATAPGRVGPAALLDVAGKEYIVIEGSESKAAYHLVSTATYSIWVKPKSHTINYQGIFTKGETGFRIHFYGMPNWPDNTDPNTKVQKNITESCIEAPGGEDFCPVQGVAKPGDDQGTAWKGVDIKNGEWHFLTQVLNGKKVSYYVDGDSAIAWSGGGNWVSGTEPVAIGNNANRARSFDGILDEARIQSVARGADWIKLDFESQKEGSKLLKFEGVTSVFRAPTLKPGKAGLRIYDLSGRLISGSDRPSYFTLFRNAFVAPRD